MTGPVAGLVLAGGLSRRMGGGDKALRTLGGRSLVDRVVERICPQVAALALNANGDPARFAAFGLPVLPDAVDGHAGPLAGVLTGLEWAAERMPEARWLATVATDTPFLPEDLVARLRHAVAADGAEGACVRSGGRDHPVFALWPVAMAAGLRQALVGEGVRRVGDWIARHRFARAVFAADPVDPFFNVNRPDDLAAAEAMLASYQVRAS